MRTDFDDYEFHASSGGKIMTNPRGEKNNLELYDEALEKRADMYEKWKKYKNELDGMINPHTQTYKKKENQVIAYSGKIVDLDNEITRLNKIKNEIKLSDTCIDYLLDVFIRERYDRIVDIESKYLEKGRMVEEDLFTMYSRYMGFYVSKNSVRKSNGYVTGEIDFPIERGKLRIYDTKGAWSLKTLWKTWAKGLESIYYWQGQIYMWLWDCDEIIFGKILIDTPDRIIKSELAKLLNSFDGTVEEYEEAAIELNKYHKFDDIPVAERIIEFPIKRNDEDIRKIPERVEKCRDFLNSIKPGEYNEMAAKRKLHTG